MTHPRNLLDRRVDGCEVAERVASEGRTHHPSMSPIWRGIGEGEGDDQSCVCGTAVGGVRDRRAAGRGCSGRRWFVRYLCPEGPPVSGVPIQRLSLSTTVSSIW